MTEGDNDQLRLQELEALDEKRLQAQQNIKLYQAWISKAFNKKVKERIIQKEDLVLAVRQPMIMTHKTKGKFHSRWKGPFMVGQSTRTEPIAYWIKMATRSWCQLIASSWRSTISDYVYTILLMKEVLYMTTLTLNLLTLRQTCLTVSSPLRIPYPKWHRLQLHSQ